VRGELHRASRPARAVLRGFADRHPRSWTLLKAAALGVPLAVISIALSLRYTPPQSTQAFGQTFQVKAAAPSLSVSGYGTGEFFQEGTFALPLRFIGPIRPSIALQQFDRNAAVASVVRSKQAGGGSSVTLGSRGAGAAFAHAFEQYFRVETFWACVLVFPLYLIGLGVVAWVRGDRPMRRRRHGRRMLAVAGFALVVNTSCIGLAAFNASSQLGRVKTLADLVGTARLAPIPKPAGPVQGDVGIAVIGDSTAAGLGNPLVPNPSQADSACGRSAYAYATALQQFNPRQRVVNLACSAATVSHGLLGPQDTGILIPAQVGVLKQMPSLSTVVVSIGANDVNWTDSLYECYGLPSCSDQASNLLFQQRLDIFKIQYAQLLEQLATLAQHPTVIINLYYQPLGSDFSCPALSTLTGHQGPAAGSGFNASGASDLQNVIQQKVDPLFSRLDQLNHVLAQGARSFDFAVATPDFTGHELCTSQPWVQGLQDQAPFHPNAAGELAIAAADQVVMPTTVLVAPFETKAPSAAAPSGAVSVPSGGAPGATSGQASVTAPGAASASP
jgi:lysophospholipase L1-like esterase